MNLDRCLNGMLLFLGIIYLLNSFYILYRYFRQRQIWQIYTIFYLTSYSYILICCYFYFSGSLEKFPCIFELSIPSLFILTSSAFLATRIVIYPDYRYYLGNLIHFLPPFLFIFYIYFTWEISALEKTQWVRSRGLNFFPLNNINDIYAVFCLLNILFYLGFQIFEISFKLFFKKELLKDKIYKNSLILLLVIRSLNLGLPIMIFTEIEYDFSIQYIKLTAIFLALNSLLLTLSIAIYIYLFKLPRIQNIKSILFPDVETAPDENYRWHELKSRLEKVMTESKIFKDEKLNVYSLAQQLDVSPRTLSEFINHSMKVSFPEYLSDLRIEEAKKLLKNTEMSVTEITYACGFYSASKFFEHFRKKTGYSPAQFKKMTIAHSADQATSH